MRLTFDEAVDVDTSGGAPRLKIDLDPAHWGAQWAVYEAGSGTESLSFAYRVVEPNESTQGIAVLVNTLELGGGTIRSVSAGSDAHLSHAGLGHDPAHKVDWRLAPVGAATVTGVAVVSDAGGGRHLRARRGDPGGGDVQRGGERRYGRWGARV